MKKGIKQNYCLITLKKQINKIMDSLKGLIDYGAIEGTMRLQNRLD